ncbi:unnamed protein product [Thlaspi arvense]|uniref:Defensin-like domain-containing protein n=1 Tax=Thlaspi arvense TaxID=13288 RepID=A0AAU9SV07_THLAR|nr:unnamed protein product [Thlaspi arvense]
MGFSKLMVTFTLLVVMSIAFDLLSGIRINAKTVPPTCYEECKATFHNPECNKFCIGLAYKNGSCIDPEGLYLSPFRRCCCNPIILAPPSL